MVSCVLIRAQEARALATAECLYQAAQCSGVLFSCGPQRREAAVAAGADLTGPDCLCCSALRCPLPP